MPEDDDKLSDAAIFRAAIGPVKPIRSPKRVSGSAQRPQPRPFNKQQHNLNVGAHDPSATAVTPVSSLDSLEFTRPGVQPKTLRRLKSGRMTIDGILDLHGLQQTQAERELLEFLSDQFQAHHRCLLIVHGKGLHGDDRHPVLKNLTQRFLVQSPLVLAFSSAQPRDGGLGAVYVLLKRAVND